MSNGPERSSPHINLTNEQIQKCIDSLGHNVQVKNYRLASSGLANTNYIVTLANDEKVVLRIHSNRTSDNGRKELSLATLLSKIPQVPKILHFQPPDDNGISYSIIEFMPGTILQEINNTEHLDTIYFEIGEMLAKLKSIKFASNGLLGDKLEIIPVKTKHNEYHRVTNFILDCLDDRNFTLRISHDIIEAIKELLIKNDALLFATDEASHLVHGDFKVENIMTQLSVDGKMHLSAVLDWEHARSDSSYGDIATLFRDDYTKDSNHKLAFYQGFTKNGATLIQDWDKACKIIDLVNICYFLCTNSERPNLFAVMRENLKKTIDYCK